MAKKGRLDQTPRKNLPDIIKQDQKRVIGQSTARWKQTQKNGQKQPARQALVQVMGKLPEANRGQKRVTVHSQAERRK